MVCNNDKEIGKIEITQKRDDSILKIKICIKNCASNVLKSGESS